MKEFSLGRKPRPLTERQKEVLQLAAKGKANKEIAVALRISGHTVKSHFSHRKGDGNDGILERLGVRNRTQASVKALIWGEID